VSARRSNWSVCAYRITRHVASPAQDLGALCSVTEISTLLARRWRSRALLSFALFSVALPTVCATLPGNSPTDVLAHWSLAVSASSCLLCVARRPIIDPIQSFILITYIWLGALPCAINILACFVDRSENAEQVALSAGVPAAALAALGLPLYTWAATVAVNLAPRLRHGPGLASLALGDRRTQSKVLCASTGLWLGSAYLGWALHGGDLSTQAFESVGTLGGSRVSSWSLGLVLAVGSIAPWLQSALMWSVVAGRRERAKGSMLLATVVTIVVAWSAVVGGWKSPLLNLLALLMLAEVGRTQRLPVVIPAAAAALFLSVVAPFVTAARHQSELVGADATSRAEVFLDVARRPGDWVLKPDSWDVAVFSRGIYLVGSEAIRRSDMWSGPWQGGTILWGLEVQVPRPLLPDKRDMNIGNFIARELGPAVGLSRAEDEVNSLAILIPCEVAANFGWFVAWLSFGVIGFLWALFCCVLLGVRRLATHPFSPVLTLFPMAMEAPLGHFLANCRGLMFGLLLLVGLQLLTGIWSLRARSGGGTVSLATYPREHLESFRNFGMKAAEKSRFPGL